MLWIAVILNIISSCWFILGSTANFQRSLDLVGRLTFIFIWIPAIFLIIVTIVLLVKNWFPTKLNVAILLIIAAHLTLSAPLFVSVETRGWLYEDIRSDPIRKTLDGKYEYRLELINLYQKNSRERLMVRNMKTGDVNYIPVEISSNEVESIKGGGKDWSWAILSPSESLVKYLLTTTKTLTMPQKKFIIDIRDGVSQRIE